MQDDFQSQIPTLLSGCNKNIQESYFTETAYMILKFVKELQQSHISNNMDQILHCIGCRTSFQESEELLPSNAIQFRGYALPFKEQNVKWNVLKAIVSFLNTKGGTILIGVSPRSNKVEGLFLERKERDNFKLSLKQLIEKIFPKVDLNHRQEVQVQYVPVFRETNFEGKFVVKIIVQQGDPTQLYCMSQKLKLVEDGSNKTDQMEIYYSYERGNNGITQFKGFDLLNEIYAKAVAATPGSIFHDDCNPEPPYLEIEIRTFRFTHINAQQYEALLLSYGALFEEKSIDHDIGYNEKTQIAQIVIEDAEEFAYVQDYIEQNFDVLDKLFAETPNPTHFVLKGEIQYYFEISNDYQKGGRKEKKQDKKVQSVKEISKFPYQERILKKEEAKMKREDKVARQMVSFKAQHKIATNQSKNIITFTHIEPHAIDNLQKFLTNNIFRKFDKKFDRFYNTLLLELNNQQEVNLYMQELNRAKQNLASYGFKRQIRYGKCQNKLKICNADFNNSKQMKKELKQMMGADLIDTKNDKNALILQMINLDQTCIWLDELLTNRNFKHKYSIHSRKPVEHTPKMKIYIDVENIATNK